MILTAALIQRGSAESKKPDGPQEVDRDPRNSRRSDAPWPVRRGGLWLRLYEHSLSLAFLLLFLIPFCLHAYSGTREYSEEQMAHGGAPVSVIRYVGSPRFWCESFQNWQSEFGGSPQSKPVDAPHSETGR